MINEERRRIQEEALEALEQNDYNGIVVLPTGTGKSWVMIEALKRIRKKVGRDIDILYLCNSTNLRDKDFYNELCQWDGIEFDQHIHYMCYQSAYKLKDNKITVLLADEFDYSLTPSYSKVYFNNEFEYKILVSATIDEKKLELAEKIAPIIYKKELQEIEDQHILNKSKYYFVNFQMTETESKEYVLLGEEMQGEMYEIQDIESLLSTEFDPKKIKSLQYKLFRHKKSMEFLTIKRKHFLNALESSSLICNRLMRDIYLEDKENRMLVFCELNKQADAISKFTYHGDSIKLGNLEKFRNGEINVLSVCGKINRGINLIGVNNIIFESCNRSKTQLTQRIGRGKRLKTNDILYVYFLVPYYMTRNNKLKPSKVREWIYKAARDLDLSKAQTYKFKH